MTLLYEPDPVHDCRRELAEKLQPRPPAGSVARCSCGTYLVVDDVTGVWRKVGRHSSIVRQAIAHYEERKRRGSAQ